MELLFKHERLTIASSDDMPGGLVIGILGWEEDEVFHHILPVESRVFLTELLGTDIFGQYTYGPLRVIKHPGGPVVAGAVNTLPAKVPALAVQSTPPFDVKL